MTDFHLKNEKTVLCNDFVPPYFVCNPFQVNASCGFIRHHELKYFFFTNKGSTLWVPWLYYIGLQKIWMDFDYNLV